MEDRFPFFKMVGVGLGENRDVRFRGVTFAIFFSTPNDE